MTVTNWSGRFEDKDLDVEYQKDINFIETKSAAMAMLGYGIGLFLLIPFDLQVLSHSALVETLVARAAVLALAVIFSINLLRHRNSKQSRLFLLIFFVLNFLIIPPVIIANYMSSPVFMMSSVEAILLVALVVLVILNIVLPGIIELAVYLAAFTIGLFLLALKQNPTLDLDIRILPAITVTALAVLLTSIMVFRSQNLRRMDWLKQRRLTELHQSLSQANKQLKELATQDQLTKIGNRLKLDSELTSEIRRISRYGYQFSLVLLDLDHFKTINDNYGHLVGDQVLVEIAALLKSRIRVTDIIGRWGGEEFMIICPETDKDGAISTAEHLRKILQDYPFQTTGQHTASFGVTTSTFDDDIDSITNRADDALYSAKAGGRNRVEYL